MSAIKKSPEIVATEELQENEQPPTDIVAYNELRSCADLQRMFRSGKLEIQPGFQREEVWSQPDRTRFVDSLIKQLPIPSMCFSLDSSTRVWKVIDGLQRMSTIVKFLGDEEFTLSRIKDVDARIAGKTNVRLRESTGDLKDLYDKVENLTLPITVIRCDYSRTDHMEFLFTIFHRLNAGGDRLNSQEIRNCIYSGRFNEQLREFDRHKNWAKIKKQIVGSTVRFRGVELILRFFALYDKRSEYRGNLPRFLNLYMHSNRHPDVAWVERNKILFDDVVTIVATKIVPRLTSKLGLSLWEALLVGVAVNIDRIRQFSDSQFDACLNAFLSADELSSKELQANLAAADKVKKRIDAAIRSFVTI